jgi:hypothetical protein
LDLIKEHDNFLVVPVRVVYQGHNHTLIVLISYQLSERDTVVGKEIEVILGLCGGFKEDAVGLGGADEVGEHRVLEVLAAKEEDVAH